MAEWTNEEFELAAKLAKDNYSAGKIGQRLGRTRNSVISKMHRAGITLCGQPRCDVVREVRRGEVVKLILPRLRSTKKKPLPIPPEEKSAPAGGIAFADLQPHQCRFELGHPYTPVSDFRFCGERREDGSPYCSHHREVSFSKAYTIGRAPEKKYA